METLTKARLFGSFMAGFTRGGSTGIAMVEAAVTATETLVIKGCGTAMDKFAPNSLKEYRRGFSEGDQINRIQKDLLRDISTDFEAQKAINKMNNSIEDIIF